MSNATVVDAPDASVPIGNTSCTTLPAVLPTPIARPPPPPGFQNLAYACREIRTITAVYKVTDRHLLADIDGERYQIVSTLWGMIRKLGGDYVGVYLVPKKVHMHTWWYVAARPPTDSHPDT